MVVVDKVSSASDIVPIEKARDAFFNVRLSWQMGYYCAYAILLKMADNKQRKFQAGWLSLFSFFENDLQQTHCTTDFPSSDKIEQ